MSKKGRKSRSVFNRITLTVVLGLFILLVATMLLTAAAVSVIVSFGAVENLWLYGIIIFAISVAIGTGLSFAYSAVMVKITRPYVEGLQKIADCDFSVRIQDSPLLAGLGIAQNFNDMAKKLESVETLREGFISDFSHEFKTPIVSLSGFVALLQRPDVSDEDKKEYLSVISEECGRLVRLSDNVLTLSGLEGRQVTLQSFVLDEQLRRCMLMFEKQCAEKGVEMCADLPQITVRSESKLLSQVWVNLLSNAVKFTPAGGKVSVSARQERGVVLVTISDTGCGMDEEVRSRIFEKFYQADSSRATQGNGLGLAIVDKIAKLLHLQVQVQSKRGEGSSFTVVIPDKDETK